MNKFGFFSLIAGILAGSAGQVLLKKGGRVIEQLPANWQSLAILFKEIFTNFYILGWAVLGGLSAFFWMIAISKLELSLATPIGLSLGLLLTMVLARLFLGEQISLIGWIGAAVIILGIFLLVSE